MLGGVPGRADRCGQAGFLAVNHAKMTNGDAVLQNLATRSNGLMVLVYPCRRAKTSETKERRKMCFWAEFRAHALHR